MTPARRQIVVYVLVVLGALSIGYPRWKHKAANQELIQAVKRGDEDAVRHLLAIGANPNTAEIVDNGAGASLTIPVLHLAFWGFHEPGKEHGQYFRIARLLADSGANLNAPHVFSALLQSGNQETIDFFLARGIQPTADALNDAIAYSDVDMVRQILALKAEVNSTTFAGGRPLCVAAAAEGYDPARQKRMVEIARLLIAKGAVVDPPLFERDAKSSEIYAEIPMCGAARNGNLAMMKLLFQHHAEVRRPLSKGSTALHLAAFQRGRADVVQWLLAHGANVNARDNYGKTPLDRVRQGSNDREIRLLLEAAGGKEGRQLTETETLQVQTGAQTKPNAAGN